ncbi:BnaA09g07090D [Brassica napus]|uniref:BnaA09g07090D protein n=2 Tax=Brassica TaxID=3705 RepID=A0A078G082_BRANA|nr:BnaA09g07090D [Brassica napus]
MTGDSCSLVSKETRLPLCDMTIVPSKRGLSSILSDFLLKSGDDSGKTFAREGSGVKFSKRLCLVVDDLVKESTRSTDTNDGSLVVDADSENLKESQGETNAVDGIGVGDDAVVELSQRECDNKDSNVADFASQTDAVTGEDLKETLYGSSNRESDDRLAMVATEGTGVLPVDSVGIVNHDMEADDELRSCSCSFCLKAAYIWSDLNYQDIKGRLSVLKKSQKETSSLIQRNSKEEPTDVEFDVMGQWTSLFLNMNDILAREGSRLQDSFVAMKELRENCKIDLERATKPPQHNNS